MNDDIKKVSIITLLLLSMITMMSNVAIVTALPALKEQFKDVANIDFYSRLIITLPSLVIAILAPIMGKVVVKFGKRNSTIVSLLVFAITGSTGLYLNQIEIILFSRAFFGIAIATLMIITTSLVGDYFKVEDRPKFMGLQNAFIGIGGILFVVGGGFLSDISWRTTFGIYLISLLLLPLAITSIKEIKLERTINNTDDKISSSIYLIYFFAFVYMSLFFLLPTQMPFLLIEGFGASGKFAGGIIASAFVSNALGAIIFVKLKSKFSYPAVLLIGLSFFAMGFSGLGLSNSLSLFFIPAPMMGFGAGIMLTNLTTWMLSMTFSGNRVKSSGYFTSALFLGQFSSPLIFQNVVDYFGTQNFFLNLGITLFVIILISMSILIIQKSKNEVSLSNS
ncbi:MFS transporter [Poseidonibacter antarcticus]|uniref:MFS transporter n=1 Tax=Poseidonibacter antarcticus TaxID=2478538 RepID=UPI000EF45A50|nr:MFS transporter [Poseidonibacter antarcticus]